MNEAITVNIGALFKIGEVHIVRTSDKELACRCIYAVPNRSLQQIDGVIPFMFTPVGEEKTSE